MIKSQSLMVLETGLDKKWTDTLLTPSEVMTICQISRTTLWRWENILGLKSIMVGYTKRFRKSDLEGFLKQHECSGERK